MKGLKDYIILLALLLDVAQLYSQDTIRLSLEQIIDSVETNYPLVLQYNSRIKSFESKAQGSKSWMPPTFSAGLNSFPYQLDMIKEKNDPMNWAAIMFSVEQMIPNPAKLRTKESYYSSLKEAQQNNAAWTKNILRTEVRTLYYRRLVAERKLELLSESRQLLDLFVAISESRYAVNQADLSTIFKAKAKVKDITNMELMVKSQISESNIGLNTLLNRSIDTYFEIDTVLALKNYDSIRLVQDTSSVQRSDINAMANAIRSMELNKKWMATGSKPDFGFRVSHMTMLGMPDQFSIMGMVTIPIARWSSSMYKSEVQSMSYEIKAMSFEKENMKLMATRMINEKLSMLKYEKEQYVNFKREIIPSYKKNLEVNLAAYKQNTGSLFVLLDAWEMLLMKQLEQLDKLNGLLTLQTEYEFETERR
ncbi:MAG TPA: TolC family protein [Chryseosolibacter sp.]